MSYAVAGLLSAILAVLLAIFVTLAAHVIRHWDLAGGKSRRNHRDYAGTADLITSLSSRVTGRRPASRQPRPDRLRPGFRTGFGPPPRAGEDGVQAAAGISDSQPGQETSP